MNISLVVFGWSGFEASTISAVFQEVEIFRNAEASVALEWQSRDALRGGTRARALREFTEGDRDLLVVLDGNISWDPGKLVTLCQRVHAGGAMCSIFAAGEPVLVVRSRESLGDDPVHIPAEMEVRRVGSTMENVLSWNERRDVVWPETDKTRVLLAIDRPKWAFDNIAVQMVKHLSDEFEFQIVPYREAAGECDVLVVFWWAGLQGVIQHVQAAKVVLCLYDAFSWLPGSKGAEKLQAYLARADVVAVANDGLKKDLEAYYGGNLPPVVVTEDGVDTDLFTPRPLPETFTVGWCGNSKSGHSFGIEDLKGLEIIREACRLADVPLEVLDASQGATVEHEDMPSWYEKISLYACASLAEGTPNPVLEALACGRPVVSTDVGLVRKVMDGGPAGAGEVVERTPEAFADAIRMFNSDILEGCALRASSCVDDQSWPNVIEAWRTALRLAVTA